MHRAAVAALGIVLVALAVPSATAQGPRGADTLSPAAVADSQAVLRSLEARVRADARDAAAWHHLGMIAWALSDRARAPNPPRTLDATLLGPLADSSLRKASQAEPTNPMYRIALGRFLLTSRISLVRFASSGHFEAGLELARKTPNTPMHAEAAIEYGRVAWRRYDALANRRVLTTPIDIGRSLNTAMQPARASSGLQDIDADQGGAAAGTNPLSRFQEAEQLIRNNTQPLPPDVAGLRYYEESEQLFREAYGADPNSGRSFRSVAMVLAERSRWVELRTFAQTHLAKTPWDGAAWMALGLASHRAGNSDGAAAAFDSAMAYLSSRDRARYDRLERVLRPSDSSVATRGTDAERATRRRFYWIFADPLWSREGNESRVEFFARVTYAELRWTVEELNVRGVDSDRGDTHVRYGPPDLIVSLGPNVQEDAQDIVSFWIYKSGLLFAFTGMATYATAQTPVDDQAMAAAIKNGQPVRWDNLAGGTVDSMPVQVTRFRGGRDSIDVVVASLPPVDSIIASSATTGAVLNSFWILTSAATVAYFDSTRLTKGGVRTWTRRLPPGGYVYRIEATSASSARAGRATSAVLADNDARSGFSRTGFGLSDMLLATSVGPQPASATRWASTNATPLVGAIKRGSELNIVWENYDFTQENGASRYSVTLTILRDRSGAGRIAWRVLGALASTARIDTQDDRYTVTFDRRMPYAPAFADQISIGLAETPAATYTVTLEVTDLVSGRKVARTGSVRVAN